MNVRRVSFAAALARVSRSARRRSCASKIRARLAALHSAAFAAAEASVYSCSHFSVGCDSRSRRSTSAAESSARCRAAAYLAQLTAGPATQNG